MVELFSFTWKHVSQTEADPLHENFSLEVQVKTVLEQKVPGPPSVQAERSAYPVILLYFFHSFLLFLPIKIC